MLSHFSSQTKLFAHVAFPQFHFFLKLSSRCKNLKKSRFFVSRVALTPYIATKILQENGVEKEKIVHMYIFCYTMAVSTAKVGFKMHQESAF